MNTGILPLSFVIRDEFPHRVGNFSLGREADTYKIVAGVPSLDRKHCNPSFFLAESHFFAAAR
jgi:hypothetical protein